METIIGLGQAGCKIAEQFAKYTQYNVYKIDSEKHQGPRFKLLKKASSHEEYENNCPSFKRFFKEKITDFDEKCHFDTMTVIHFPL